MNDFGYHRVTSVPDAIAGLRQGGSAFVAGGTNLLDLMKVGVAAPRRLVDIGRLPLDQVTALPDGGLRIGALARNSAVANHPLVRERYPLLSQALLAGASPQLRNMATTGGNLMQRTRCWFFYDNAYEACNKRQPGSGCAALQGPNRNHAVLGASAACIATHPSDQNVALAALRATVRLAGPEGERVIPVTEFHRLPGDTPQFDTVLRADEMITAVDLPPSPFAVHAHYLKVRDRASYAFALVSVAAAVQLRDGYVQDAALALGGVAHRPWRVPAAEEALRGRPLGAQSIAAATIALLQGAQGHGDNSFKIELARRSIGRALLTAAGAA